MSKLETALVLPEDITIAEETNPRDLVIVGIPKVGKGSILGSLTKCKNALVLDLEHGGYEYIDARKLSTYDKQDSNKWDSFKNYIKYRNLLLENKGKYDYLIIDGLSDLDDLSQIGGTLAYMNTVQGKKFNREGNSETGKKYEFTDPEWKSVNTLGEGYGYQFSRKWFLDQIDIFRQISPYRIYAAHIADKLIKENGKEEVTGAEIALTGKLKTIFAAKVTALAKLVADENKRYLNFEVVNDAILAGSRNPKLKGRILISEKNLETDEIVTFWEKIFK